MVQHLTIRQWKGWGAYKLTFGSNVQSLIVRILSAIVLVVAVSVRAQEEVDITFTWTDPGVAGWTNGSSEVTLSNPGGYLNMAFQAQAVSYSVSDIARVDVGPGLWAVNISFRFRPVSSPPSAVALYLHSGTSGNTWYLTLPAPTPGLWTDYNIPVSFDAGWILGPVSSEEQFSKDIVSVDWVGVYVRRFGDAAAQNYRIDDFRIQGIQTPQIVSVSGTVYYNGNLDGPIRVSAVSVGGISSTSAVVTIGSPGYYQIDGLPMLTDYIISGYRDSNSNNVKDFWEADGTWSGNCLSVLLTGFSDIDITITDPKSYDGMPYWWLNEYFGVGSAYEAEGMADYDDDGDGMNNYAEYVAGTNPTNLCSTLALSIDSTNEVDPANGIVIKWNSVGGHFYTMKRSTNLIQGFFDISNNIPATPPINTFNDVSATNSGQYFYRIIAE
ncbi:MAG: thrombospondin type 3 repeat-containing protein [Kiritimatiellae bacterium]|nr:thrombospondin type 3 repeat-containing protein [Kiritimatiellia bacterium]MDD5520361.1 thrombospondin type 3 repeat-containing protein [Kiritimatiellia bacterium]